MTQVLTLNNNTTNIVSSNRLLSITKNENKESITLIWFDPNIGSRDDIEQTTQLRLINDYVIIHIDLERCISFIQSINKEKIFLITSGSEALHILPRISTFSQIDSIFIFCMKKNRYEYLLNKYTKIIGIYNNLNDLCKSIKEQIDLINKQIQTFSFFNQHETLIKDLSYISTEFLWIQLFNSIITNLPRNQQAKRQMIEICKEYYYGNTKEMKTIYEFERYYQSKDAIFWYSKQSFIYKLINKALRIEDIDLLYKFRFFISDLSENLRSEHEKILLSQEKIFNVYRGIKLTREEFNKLKENQGKFISINGYLSTTRQLSLALNFALKPTKRIDIISVLFHIQCDITKIDENIIFADIDQFSEYPGEQEVLFDLNACFQIQSIEENQSLKIIKMNLSNQGQKFIKDFIELKKQENQGQSISIIFGRLLCDLGQYDKSQNYFQQLFNDSNDEDSAWIEFNIGRALHLKRQWKEAHEYYNRAYDRMMENQPARIKDSAHVLNNIGNILTNQGKHSEAHDYLQRALKIREEFYPPDHVAIAHVLNNMGNVFVNQGKYDDAFDYYKRALKIKQKFYPSDHPDIAISFNNIGNILSDQGEYDEALNHYQQALKIDEKFYPSTHINIAQNLNEIGRILFDQGKYNDALDYHQRALKIREEFYSSDHVDIADSLNNIGICYENQKKRKIALDYYQRALTIYEKFLPFNHPSRQRTEKHICRLTQRN